MSVLESFYDRIAYWVNIRVRPLLKLYETVQLFHPQKVIATNHMPYHTISHVLVAKAVYEKVE